MRNPVKRKDRFFDNISVTTKLIVLNVLIFIAVSIFSSIYGEDRVLYYLALTPSHLLAAQNLWTIVTHMFLHANLMHLFFNMLSLWFIGRNLEKIIGPKRYFWTYIFSGIVAGLFFALLSGLFGFTLIGGKLFGDPNISGVGASGAIFGLLGVMTLLFPKTKIYLIAGPILALIAQAIFDSVAQNNATLTVVSFLLNFYIIFSLFALISYNFNLIKLTLPIQMRIWVLPIVAIVPLIIIGLEFSLPIANTAHLGGFLAGAAYGLYLRIRYKKKIKMLERYFQ